MFFRRKLVLNRRFRQLAVALLVLALFIVIRNSYHSVNFHQKEHGKSSRNFDAIHQHTSTPRIFCFILTTPGYFLTRTKSINDTWAPRCDRYFFITEPLPNNATFEQHKIAQQFPIAPIKNLTQGYAHLTQRSNAAFLFAYENYYNDYDWFVKADDDTYLFVDHLKRFLSDKNTSEPVTYGYNFKVNINVKIFFVD